MEIKTVCDAVVQSAFGLSMGAVWQHISVECAHIPDNDAFRFDVFFHLLERLMDEGKIRLASDGQFLSGTAEQQLERIKNAWPHGKPDDELDDPEGAGLWFLAKSPAGIVWLMPDGREIWT
ncbi:hypothetical protein CWS43_16140 [Rahnella sp. AA]|uniref:DUF596 domain-containing protein n=1 Tax=Rahnella sp. AA TaxID=2057180 RepID=UPI000C337B87|nr:DUF596 domain-containing protein [Rahnella sp. AA]PKE29568.1 hypothetical protein CWS43_16140 [Rahnella sp. AA]